MSKFLSINWQDVLKGLVMAVLTPAFTIIYQSIEAGSFTFDWKAIGVASIAGGFAYLFKNFFSKPTE